MSSETWLAQLMQELSHLPWLSLIQTVLVKHFSSALLPCAYQVGFSSGGTGLIQPGLWGVHRGVGKEKNIERSL